MGKAQIVEAHPRCTTSLTTRVLALSNLAGAELRPVGIAPLPAKAMTFAQPAGSPWDWLILRLECDPLFASGELEIPKAQRAKLRRLDAIGVTFDELLIAHEVTKGRANSAKLEGSAELKALLSSGPSPEIRRLDNLARLVTTASRVAASAPLAALAAVAADPVLIGALTVDGTPSPGTLAAFFEIARW